MGFHCHNNKDHYRNTLHAPCRLEDRLGWVKVDYDRLVCLCLSALGGRSSTDIILQIDIHLSPLCSGSRRDISSCQHRWLFIPFCRHIDIFQTEARKKLLSFRCLCLHSVHLLSTTLLDVKRGRTKGCGTDSREMEARAPEECAGLWVCVCARIFIWEASTREVQMCVKGWVCSSAAFWI